MTFKLPLFYLQCNPVQSYCSLNPVKSMNLDLSNTAEGFPIGVIIYSFLILCPEAITKLIPINSSLYIKLFYRKFFFLLKSTVTTLNFFIPDTKTSYVVTQTPVPRVLFLLYFYSLLDIRWCPSSRDGHEAQ